MPDILLSSLIPSGKGSFGINYIKNFNAEDNNTNGWLATNPSDVGISIDNTNVVRGTKSFNLSKASGSQINKYIYYPFTIDTADKNKQLTISLDYFVTANYAANDVVLQVRDVTNGVTINVANPGLPKFTSPGAYSHKTSFMSTNSSDYELRITVNTTNSSAYNIYFDNVRVGPDSFVSGTPVTDWINESITWNQNPGLSVSGLYQAPRISWRRSGDKMEGFVEMRNGSSAASNNVMVSFRLPQGLTINSALYPSLPGDVASVGTTDKNAVIGSLYYYPQGPGVPSKSLFFDLANVTLAANTSYRCHFSVAVAEWAGSTVSIDNSQVEYAYSTTAFNDSDDTNPANTAYGPQGAPFAAVNLTNARVRRVKFLTPIQPTDVVDTEISADGGKSWVSVGSGVVLGVVTYVLPRFTYVDGGSSTNHHGIGARIVDAAAGTVDVYFGRYFFKATNGSVIREWGDTINSTYRWRVSKSRNPLSIGGLTGTKWQRKFISSDLTGTGDVSVWQFNNVVVGRTYRITGSCIAFKNTTGDFNIAHIKVMSGASNTGTKYAESYAQHQFTTGSIGAAGTYTVPVYIPGSVFTAVSSTVYIHVILGSSMRIDAGTGDRSWMLLEELPLHTQTSEWT